MLARRIEVPGRVKMQNADALRNLDVIQQAMRMRRNVEFRYFHYDVNKQQVPNNEGMVYSVTPVRLVYADELYYLISFMEKWADREGHQPFAPYRVDRMIDVRVSDEPAPRDARIANWRTEEKVSPGFGVFAAEKVPMVLEFDQSAMNPIIDKFGIEAIVFEKEGGRARAHVKAPMSPQFYGWLLQLGPMVRIVKPKRAVEEFAGMLESVRRMYMGGYRILSELGDGCVTQEQFLKLVEDLENALVERAKAVQDGGFACEWDFICFAGDFVEARLAELGVDDGMPKKLPEPREVRGKMITPLSPIDNRRYTAYGQVVGEALIAVDPRKWAAPEAVGSFTDVATRYDTAHGEQFELELPPRPNDWKRLEGTRRRRWMLSGASYFESWCEARDAERKYHCKLVAPEIGLAELEVEPWLDPTSGSSPAKAAAKLWQRLAYRFS